VKVLIVDDDPDLCDLLDFALQRAGLDVVIANDGTAAVRAIEAQPPDVVLLDVDLGADNGFEVLRELRRRSGVPVIMLTALDNEDDRVRGLDLGADDYVTKPFSHRELVARVRAQIRRSGDEPPARRGERRILRAGPLELDVGRHVLMKGGHPIDLTATEFRLLQVLMQERGTVVPTQRLLEAVWGYRDPGAGDVVRAAVHRLRRKLEDDPSKPRLIQTIPSVGVLVRDDTLDGRASPGGPRPD
jgi:DNA-binding response OmpR family regulator